MSLVGVGLYTYGEASKLTNASVSDLNRWLKGYTYKNTHSKETTTISPLWEPELVDEDIQAISFHDLLEIRFVIAFRKHGVSLQAIRIASQHARDLYNHTHPFTCKKFETDGKSIFGQALKETGEIELLDLVKKQYAMHQIIESSLYKGIEFGNDDLACKWYPLDRSKLIFLDPEIAFGKPIVSDGHVRTSILYDSYKVEKNARTVSKIYEIPIKAVEAAIKFEEQLAA